MKYLFLGSHTDDIEICCGGTVAKAIDQGHDVKCHAFSSLFRNDLKAEYCAGMAALQVGDFSTGEYPNRILHERRQEVAQDLIQLAKGYDFVFTHSKFDCHPDHATVGFECERVLKSCNLVTYCAPWNGLGFDYNYFVKVFPSQAERKIAACSKYTSQQHRPYMNPDYLYSELRVAGIQCGSVFAERFRVVRLIN